MKCTNILWQYNILIFVNKSFLTYNIIPIIVCFVSCYRCVICMNEFVIGDPLRYLPCLHTYHKECIDDWLMRSFTCPSCMEPVESALLTTYETC